MLTHPELFQNVVLPVLISAVIAGIGAWRRWPFTMPLAIGAAFITAYATTGLPKYPPHDGSDWLFWLAIALTLIAVAESLFGKLLVGAHPSGTSRFGWLLGASTAAP